MELVLKPVLPAQLLDADTTYEIPSPVFIVIVALL